MHKQIVLCLILCFGTITTLICETCDGSTCYDKDRWIEESCPPSTQFCYRFSSEGRAYRRGCADYPCATLPDVGPNTECRTCSQDRCNNERDSFFHQRGGGVSWKSNSNRGYGLITNICWSLLMILFMSLY